MKNQKALARKSISTNTETQENQFEGRGFAVQNKSDIQTQKTDLNTQLKRAITYGHSISKFAGQENSSASPQTNGLSIQAKLSIGEPGDKYEQEADRVASEVVQRINAPSSTGESVQREAMPESEEELQMKPQADSIQRLEDDEEELQMKSLADSIQRVEIDDEEEVQMKTQVQRREAIAGGEASTDLESSINSARGGGQAIAPNIREPMEEAFGRDFSGVKVHTDGQSDQLNRSIQARAFTTGQDVFFGQGEYNPGSRGGQELLAHELTHVVQQSGGAVQRSPQQEQTKQVIQRKVKITDHLEFNVHEGKPTIGENVLNNPPDYVNAEVDGQNFRLKAGQDFISESKGTEYIADPDKISGADARLLKPMVDENEPEDVRVVGDGHHKLLFSTYHGKDCAGGTKIGFLKGQPWSGLKWTKDIKDK